MVVDPGGQDLWAVAVVLDPGELRGVQLRVAHHAAVFADDRDPHLRRRGQPVRERIDAVDGSRGVGGLQDYLR